MTILEVQLLSDLAIVPKRATNESIGLDLWGIQEIGNSELISFEPFQRKLIPTGLAIAIPKGYYGRIAPRSGLASKKGIDIMAGVIDADYRGEVKVLVVNLSDRLQIVDLSYPIAQLILEKAATANVMVVSSLSETERNEKGFGSSDTVGQLVNLSEVVSNSQIKNVHYVLSVPHLSCSICGSLFPAKDEICPSCGIRA